MAHAMQLPLEEADHRARDFHIKLILLDSSGPDKVLQVDLEAADDPAVLIYLGSPLSRGYKVGLPILNRVGLAQISPGASYPGLTRPDFGAGEPGIYCPSGEHTFFRLVATDDMQGLAGVFWAQDLGRSSSSLPRV